jgi:acetyl esterase/lipase
MNRAVLILFALAFVPVLMSGQFNKDHRDLSRGGKMSLAELRREPITFKLDIPYAATGNPRHRLDLYLPKNRISDKLPVIVFFHGGGWMQGNKSDGAGRMISFICTGQYAGVSVEYRLSSEAQWPAQLHDCKAAVRWVRANARKYGLDPDRIGVWGRSAGGHLALMLGVSADIRDLDGDIGPYKGVSSKAAAVVNFFGVTDLPALIGEQSDIDRTGPFAPEAMLIGGPLLDNPEKAKAASPITYITADDPPVLTVHGKKDRIVPFDQAVRLDTKLRKSGVASFFIIVKEGGHGDFGTAADDRVKAFFDRYLWKKKVDIATTPLEKR